MKVKRETGKFLTFNGHLSLRKCYLYILKNMPRRFIKNLKKNALWPSSPHAKWIFFKRSVVKLCRLTRLVRRKAGAVVSRNFIVRISGSEKAHTGKR